MKIANISELSTNIPVLSTNIPALSIKKTSRMLEVSPSYVSYLLAEGELDFFLPPGKKHRKVTLESINRFIERYTYNNKMKDQE